MKHLIIISALAITSSFPSTPVDMFPEAVPVTQVSSGSSGGTSPYFYAQAWGGTLSDYTVEKCDYANGCVNITKSPYWQALKAMFPWIYR